MEYKKIRWLLSGFGLIVVILFAKKYWWGLRAFTGWDLLGTAIMVGLILLALYGLMKLYYLNKNMIKNEQART